MPYLSNALYFEDVEVGREWLSHGRTVTEADIVNYAGLSGDFNSIHMDHEFAKTTPFRRPIAHGLLIFSIGSGLAVLSPVMRTIALLRVIEWHFREPVFVGDTLKMRSRILEMTLRGRGKRGEIVWQRAIVNQDEKVVQEGRIVTLVEGRGINAPAENRAALVPEAVAETNGTHA